MSTYYFLGCVDCKKCVSYFTRQAWGWGNLDIIMPFKCAALHTETCGAASLVIVPEQIAFDMYDEYEGSELKKFLEATRGMFPHSNDWTFDEKLPKGSNIDDEWIKQKLADSTS